MQIWLSGVYLWCTYSYFARILRNCAPASPHLAQGLDESLYADDIEFKDPVTYVKGRMLYKGAIAALKIAMDPEVRGRSALNLRAVATQPSMTQPSIEVPGTQPSHAA